MTMISDIAKTNLAAILDYHRLGKVCILYQKVIFAIIRSE